MRCISSWHRLWLKVSEGSRSFFFGLRLRSLFFVVLCREVLSRVHLSPELGSVRSYIIVEVIEREIGVGVDLYLPELLDLLALHFVDALQKRILSTNRIHVRGALPRLYYCDFAVCENWQCCWASRPS